MDALASRLDPAPGAGWFTLRRTFAGAALVACLVPPTLGACARDDHFAEGREHFLANRLEQALPLLEQAVRARPEAARHAWLAETYRRLQRPDDALGAARRALDLDSCEPYAHQVLADLYNPLYSGWEQANGDSTWAHARAAVACDPDFASAWLVVWLQGLLRGEHAEENRALRELAARRFFTPATLAFGRWLLATAPARAVLVTNGDMDTYPLHVLQASESLRTDVAIVNLSLLNAAAYRRVMRDRHALPIPDALIGDEAQPERDPNGRVVVVADRVLKGWADAVASRSFGRPLAIATTVFPHPVAQDRLVLDGARWIVMPAAPAAVVDTAAVRAHLFALRAAEFTGRWTSDADRSPVRRLHSPALSHNLLAAASRYVAAVGTDSPEAASMKRWALGFVTSAGLDSVARAAAQHLGDDAWSPAPHP